MIGDHSGTASEASSHELSAAVSNGLTLQVWYQRYLAHTEPAMNASGLIRALALLRLVSDSAASLNAVNEGYVRPGIIRYDTMIADRCMRCC